MASKLMGRSPTLAARLLVAIALGCGLNACLPADTRPLPGTLVVNVTSDESLSPEGAPVETEDGWSITFERFVLGIGNTGFNEDDDACNDYQGFGSQYGRLLDLRAQKSQRLSEMRFLGTCDFSFEIAQPRQIDVLGEGVAEADLLAMRYPVDDAFTKDRGVALHAVGSARKGDQLKRFDWAFRQGIIFQDCRVDGETGIEMASEESKTLDIVVSGSVLFQRALADTALHFDAFAEADDVHGDGDGNVTLEEMAEVALEPEDGLGQGGSAGPEEIHTLADLVYLGLVPQVARYGGDGTCDLRQVFDAEEPGGGPGGD
jgi:hypothetical protein